MLVHDLISRLGGPTALGRKIAAAPKAVSMWSKRNAIPREYHLAIWRLAISEKIDWTPPGGDGLTLIPAAPKPTELQKSPSISSKPAPKRSRAPVKPSPKPKQGTRAADDHAPAAEIAA